MLRGLPVEQFKVARSTVRDQAVEKLKSAIVAGHLRPGQRLVERDLCDLIGVSRTSIREALRLLEGEKLIVAQPHRGPCVALPSPEEAEQIYEVRAVLEAWAGRGAAARAKPDEVQALRRSVDAFGMAVTRNDLPSLVRLANEFYDVLFAASRNPVAADLLKSLHTRISFLRATSMSNPGRAPHSLAEMRAIARAIERRDPDAAAAACIRHVEMAAKSAKRRFAELVETEDPTAGRSRKAANR